MFGLLSVANIIFSFISALGILQGFLLAALIYFHPKSDRTVNLFLALYVACISLIMSMPLFFDFIGWQNSFFLEPFPFLTGPLIYLFVRSYHEPITWRKAIPHLAPFILSFFISYWIYADMSRRFPDSAKVPEDVFREVVPIVFIILRFIQNITYFLLSRRELIRYQHSIRHVFSETSLINLRWVKWLINGYLLFVFLTILFYSLMLQFPDKFQEFFLLNFALVTPYIYITTYKGITQPTFWQKKGSLYKEEIQSQIKVANEAAKPEPEDSSSLKTDVEDGISKEIINRINRFMENEKLFQEPELTIKELADKIQYPYYQVSQVINNSLKKNFYDLVNGYRVEEAKRLLLHPDNQNYTILSVGFEAGFNSKTTFNTVFKKFTGLTPTEYRNKQNKPA